MFKRLEQFHYFNCSNYKGNCGTSTSAHYVRVYFLEQVVHGEIKWLTIFASHYEDDFVKAVMGSAQQNVTLDRKLKEKELAALQARDEELDGVFERIYADNVSGKLFDDRFSNMSRRYEDEQKGFYVKCWGVPRKTTEFSYGNGRNSGNQRKPF